MIESNTRTFRFNPNELHAQTSGTGLWSRTKRDIQIKRIDVTAGMTADEQFVRVYWYEGSWDVDKDGLIYTDNGFQKSLKEALFHAVPSVDWRKLSFTEQGMQGKDHVHMILGVW